MAMVNVAYRRQTVVSMLLSAHKKSIDVFIQGIVARGTRGMRFCSISSRVRALMKISR